MKPANDAAKLAALRRLAGSFYLEHVQRFGVLSDVATCWCALDHHDEKCDLGSALIRIRWRETVMPVDRERIP